jgi:putative methionine-R-sulfoxide reductase with GAF domain
MAFDFTKSLQAMQRRKFGDDLKKGDLFENFSGKASDSILYISEAMEPVSEIYTDNTYKQCNRVINQVKENISHNHSTLSFEYQGSVPLNVHIKQHSDIDLLVVTGRFYWVTPPLPVVNPYSGNSTNDLIELRKDIVDTISNNFPAVEIDDTGAKATSIQGGSLNRKIDLVPCSWVHNTNSYGVTDLTPRGIKLYDKKDQKTIENYPFMHIARCHGKDLRVGGKYKMLVRYIKNLIKDSDDINISSYDAAGLMYLQGETELIATEYNPVALSRSCEAFLLRILNDPQQLENAMVPNGTRKLFGTGYLNVTELLKLYLVIREINSTVNQPYLNMLLSDRIAFERQFRNAS